MMVFDQNQYLVGWHVYDQNKYLVLRDASVMVNGASMMVNHIFSVIRNGVRACLQAIRSGAEKLPQEILLRLQHNVPGGVVGWNRESDAVQPCTRKITLLLQQKEIGVPGTRRW